MASSLQAAQLLLRGRAGDSEFRTGAFPVCAALRSAVARATSAEFNVQQPISPSCTIPHSNGASS